VAREYALLVEIRFVCFLLFASSWLSCIFSSISFLRRSHPEIAADPNNSTYLQVVNSISQNIKRQWNPDKKDKEKLIKDKQDKEESIKAEQRMQLERAPKPLLPRDFGREPVNIFVLDAEEIARQMTIYDWKIWVKVTNVEFVDLAWKGKDKEKASPNRMHAFR
jgi:hypothetical protein